MLRKIFLLILISAIALTGCSNSIALSKSQIITSILADPKTFNYALSQESPNIFGLTYLGLINEDGLTGEVIPELAQSWEISPDKKTITFTMKEDLKWSDGEPLTVDDVVFTYNDIYMNEKIPTDIKDGLKIGKKRLLPTVKKIDNKRVEFAVPEPFAPFLRNMGTAILPKHALETSVKELDKEGKPKFLTTWGINTPPKDIIVNGPYKLESYKTSERVIFTRNPYYWRKDTQGKQQPYIEKYIWQIVENTDTILMKFRTRSTDSIGVSPDYFGLLKKEEKIGDFTIYNGGPATGVSFIGFNLNTGSRKGKPLVEPIKSQWFRTLEFRQAVAYGIDRRRMINNIYRGLGDLQNSPISVPTPYYLSPKDGLKVYEYNPEKSKELLLKIGFKYNDKNELFDGKNNRVKFTLITNAGNKTREAMGAQIKQDLAKIGIQVDFEPIAWNLLLNKLDESLDWESYLLGFTGGVEPNDGANVWALDGNLHSFNQDYSKAKISKDPKVLENQITDRKIYDWEQKIADLYIQGASELDEVKRKKIYGETQQITQENLPYIYLVNPLSLGAVRNKIKGIKYSPLNGAFWNIYELSIDN